MDASLLRDKRVKALKAARQPSIRKANPTDQRKANPTDQVDALMAPEACWPMPKSRDRGLKGSRPADPPMSSSWRRRPRWRARSGR